MVRGSASAPVSPRPGGRHLRHVSHSSPGTGEPSAITTQSLPPQSVLDTINTRTRSFPSNASVVLIGIRGSGKRSLGFIAATALGRRFVTEDHFFQSVTGFSRQDYLRNHGSEEFHKHDMEISRRMLDENRVGCVIDCGLGSLTSGLQEYLRTYSRTNPVIYILRHMDNITQLLKLDERSARLLETADPTHRRCSNYEFYNLEDKSAANQLDSNGSDRGSPTYSFKLREAQADFSYFVKFITGYSNLNKDVGSPFSLEVPVEKRLYTHALEIRMSLYRENKIQLSKMESGGDVAEVHVDRWDSKTIQTLSRMVADVRRSLNVPIMLSVAKELLAHSVGTYVNVLDHGLRLGVELLSVDINLNSRDLARLIASKGSTRFVVTSVSESTDPAWEKTVRIEDLRRSIALKADMVRLLHVATSREDNESLGRFMENQEMNHGQPLIAYNVGPLGRTSQIFNKTLTTVTHQHLRPFLEANSTVMQPQLTSREVMKALFSTFVLDALEFLIVGGNVSTSLSPAMHNAAYKLLGLGHNYRTRDITSWSDIESLSQNPHFGGASVVQPWKVKIVSKLAHLSDHARTIGAINTLLPLRAQADGHVPSLEGQARHRNRAGNIVAWYGDNTDWIGISTCIRRSLSPRNVIQSRTTGLIIGAGGMSRAAVYALLQLGCRNIFVYNRTRANTETVVNHYNSWIKQETTPNGLSLARVHVLTSLDEAWPSDHVLPTMVVSCVTHEHIEGRPDADFTMPVNWLQSESGGVVVEMAYMKRETPLIKQIKRFRETTRRPWVIVDGLETLLQQAGAQFEIMTGRKAPTSCMWDAITTHLQEVRSFVADAEEFEVV